MRGAIEQAQSDGVLARLEIPEIVIERPQNTGHGDYASSLPLKMARSMGKNPLEIGREIVKRIELPSEFSVLDVVAPGFINFTLSPDWLCRQVPDILAAGEDFGNIDIGKGAAIQVEFVSANPTGPLHVGNGRGAVIGSTLANILEAAGYNVQKEYYINDAGNQMDSFHRSLYARYQQACGVDAEMPQEGYHGQYVTDLARQILDENGRQFIDLPQTEALVALGKVGVRKMLEKIRADLGSLGVDYDSWFSEQSLFDNGQFGSVIELLDKAGYLTQKEGAVWFASTVLGENKDNVVVRSSGSATYFGTDIAYHYNKFIERKFDKVIDIWGADHQGHVSRMGVVMKALGVDPTRLRVIIAQMVTLKRGGECVRLSKRSGDMITLREVIDEVGADACRFFFLARSADSQMDFDLDLARQESAENPVYYVQYAHARTASILRLAEEEQIDYTSGDVRLLTGEPEQALIRIVMQLPEIVEYAAHTFEPHNLPHYAQNLATAFHSFYKLCRVISKEDPEQSKARLKLVAAAKTVLARTLGLMGMAAPETM